MRQLQILLNYPKIDIGLFVDLAEFTCFYQFLHDVIIELFCFDRHTRKLAGQQRVMWQEGGHYDVSNTGVVCL